MIKFIYFDVGGVVIQDFSGNDKWLEFKQTLGVPVDLDKDFDNYFDQKEVEICKGKDIESIHDEINKLFKLNLPSDFSILDEFVRRFERNESIWSVINDAKSKYQVGLLTNMYPGMLDAIKGKSLLPEIEWDVMIDSSNVGYAKPEREIYEIAQREAGVLADEILFVENSKRNIDAADKMGWQTFHYNSSTPENSSKLLRGLI